VWGRAKRLEGTRIAPPQPDGAPETLPPLPVDHLERSAVRIDPAGRNGAAPTVWNLFDYFKLSEPMSHFSPLLVTDIHRKTIRDAPSCWNPANPKTQRLFASKQGQ